MKKQKTKQFLIAILITVFTIASLAAYSQEKKRVLEISTTTFDQFNLRYKFGNENILFRLASYDLGFSSNQHKNAANATKSFNIGAGFGLEFPKQINEKIAIYYGPELRGSFLNTKNGSTSQAYLFSLNGIFGFNYLLNDHLTIGAELSPGFYYHKQEDDNAIFMERFSFDISHNFAEIVLGFHF